MRFWKSDWTFDDNPVAVILPEPLSTKVRELLATDQYVPAVRLVRQRTHLGLLPAALAVNAVRDAPR